MARKREERVAKATFRKEQKTKAQRCSDKDDSFVSFNNQLATMGLALREIPGDGNCLFRALGDQLEGHSRHHLKHRHDTVEYMRRNRADFEPFVEDDRSFDSHIENLGKPGIYAGNDAIVAFARLHEVTIVIHQLITPLWQIHGVHAGGKNVTELHIAYHNGDHYNSVRRIGDHSESPANIRLCVVNKDGGKQSKEFSPQFSGSQPMNQWEDYHRLGSEDESNADESEDDAVQMNDSHTGSSSCLSRNSPSSVDSDGLWGPNGTGTRIIGISPNVVDITLPVSKASGLPQGNRNTKHLSSRQQKDLKRQERKKNAEARRRNKVMGKDHVMDSNEEYSDLIVVNDLGCLSI